LSESQYLATKQLKFSLEDRSDTEKFTIILFYIMSRNSSFPLQINVRKVSYTRRVAKKGVLIFTSENKKLLLWKPVNQKEVTILRHLNATPFILLPSDANAIFDVICILVLQACEYAPRGDVCETMYAFHTAHLVNF
jgi:hypothetical protein